MNTGQIGGQIRPCQRHVSQSSPWTRHPGFNRLQASLKLDGSGGVAGVQRRGDLELVGGCEFNIGKFHACHRQRTGEIRRVRQRANIRHRSAEKLQFGAAAEHLGIRNHQGRGPDLRRGALGQAESNARWSLMLIRSPLLACGLRSQAEFEFPIQLINRPQPVQLRIQ